MSTVSSVSTSTHKTHSSSVPATVREGSHGAAVVKLQQALIARGYDPHGVDGSFGPKTDAAVRAFQRAHGLKVDGLVGPITWHALLKSPAKSGGNSHSTPSTPSQTGWTNISRFDQDYQDTDHTCGPSSMQMLFSELTGSTKVSESQLATWAGTTGNGTSHQGLFAAARTAASRLGFSVKCSQASLGNVGWAKLAQMIADPKVGVILHIQTGGLPGWKGDYGHYVFPVGVDLAHHLVKIADPVKGVHTYTFAQYERAMGRVSQPSVLMVQRS
jgi:peptidoglycan hydrolase-like protein with peptidoglycan-binding domain